MDGESQKEWKTITLAHGTMPSINQSGVLHYKIPNKEKEISQILIFGGNNHRDEQIDDVYVLNIDG